MSTFGIFFLHQEYAVIAVRGDPLNEIEGLIDWNLFRPRLSTLYQSDTDQDGRPQTDVIVLMKPLVLQQWYGLSDYELERQAGVGLLIGAVREATGSRWLGEMPFASHTAALETRRPRWALPAVLFALAAVGSVVLLEMLAGACSRSFSSAGDDCRDAALGADPRSRRRRSPRTRPSRPAGSRSAATSTWARSSGSWRGRRNGRPDRGAPPPAPSIPARLFRYPYHPNGGGNSIRTGDGP